ncbi:adenosine deaminase/editase [Pyronema domesticum]|nr:adenosine deaminase/editase [Pyronema domesticum]
MTETTRADRVADAVLQKFTRLEKKFKPRENEWVPLSGVVLELDGELECVALGTGMKCLPAAKVPLAKGCVLHDCHAEVLATRGFNCFLLHLCRHLKENPTAISRYLTRTPENPQPYTINHKVKIHFYSSEAPCGDGSMELTMASQEDSTPWTFPTPGSTSNGSPTPNPAPDSGVFPSTPIDGCEAPSSSGGRPSLTLTIPSLPSSTDTPPISPISPNTHLRGRGYFSALGLVRTKPGRGDAPPTASKSCSDKFSLRQVLSLLLSPTCHIISPENAYIHSLIIPSSQYTRSGCHRAFSAEGRMASLSGRSWDGGYAFRPFDIETTDLEFEFSKRLGGAGSSNISAVLIDGVGEEALINGVKQGRKAFSRNMPGSASLVSKYKIWKMAGEVEEKVTEGFKGYAEMKEALGIREGVKQEAREALGGWIRNGGNDWGLN